MIPTRLGDSLMDTAMEPPTRGAAQPELEQITNQIQGLRERVLMAHSFVNNLADRLYGPNPQSASDEGLKASEPMGTVEPMGMVATLEYSVGNLREAIEMLEGGLDRLQGLT